MSKALIEIIIGALLIAMMICVARCSLHLCDSAVNNPQAFFAGKVH